MFGLKSKPTPPPPPVEAGQEFMFLGIHMLCMGMSYMCNIPYVNATYVDKHGVIREVSFPPREWYALAVDIRRYEVTK